MPKSFPKILVLGASAVGKTSIIEQLVYGSFDGNKEMHSTIEDTYDCWIDSDKVQKERIRIYDLKGLEADKPLPMHFISIADGFVLVFSVTSNKSFALVEQLKKEIERLKGKDFPMVVLGNKVDMSDARECDHVSIIKWANTEKVKLFEVIAMTRNTIQEPLTYLVKKINANISKRNADVKGLFRRGGGGKSFKDNVQDG